MLVQVKKVKPWTGHKAPDGRSYFYNSETKQSSWSKPEELMTRGEVDTPHTLAHSHPHPHPHTLTEAAGAEQVEGAQERLGEAILLQHGDQRICLDHTPGTGGSQRLSRIDLLTHC